MTPRALQAAFLIVLALVSTYLVLSGSTGVTRHVLVSVFMLIGPGLAFMQWWNLRDYLYELVLGMALSVALATIIATAMMYTGTWSPDGGFLVLAGLSVLSSVTYLISGTRGWRFTTV